MTILEHTSRQWDAIKSGARVLVTDEQYDAIIDMLHAMTIDDPDASSLASVPNSSIEPETLVAFLKR